MPYIEDAKVRDFHLEKNAYLYVRQSTLRQVAENTESTRRQYGLKKRAVSMGWQEEQIQVIDMDLGKVGLIYHTGRLQVSGIGGEHGAGRGGDGP